MFTVLGKQNLNLVTKRLDVRADELVAQMKPGQFVTLMADRFSRLRPFNVYDIDWRRKCVSLVYEVKDAETAKMRELKINDEIFAVYGPYGMPCEATKKGTVVFVGEGLGLGSLVGLCRAFKMAGNKVIGIAGFEARKSSILENQMRLNCNKFYGMYKDGMHERRGDILGPLKKVLLEEQVVEIYAHVSGAMFKDVYYLAWENKIPLKVNVMDVLDARPGFFETASIMLKGRRHFPAVEGIFVDALELDIQDFVTEIDGLKEYEECRKRESVLLAQKSVFARLKKFIWG